MSLKFLCSIAAGYTRFVESIDINIKVLVANAVPESTKSPQNMLSMSIKVKKLLDF